MAVTARHNGALECIVDAAADMLSNCAEVIAFLGVADEAAALAAMHKGAVDSPPDLEELTETEAGDQRPIVWVFIPLETGTRLVRDSVGGWLPSGSVLVYLERALTGDEEDEPKTAIAAMNRTLGRIGDELEQLEASSGGLTLVEIQILGPFVDDRDNRHQIGPRIFGQLELVVNRGV